MSGFKPIHAAHAIERVSTGIQFAQPLNEADFKEIRELASTFTDDLPRQVEIQGMMLSIGPPGGSPDPPFPGGFLLQNMESDGSSFFSRFVLKLHQLRTERILILVGMMCGQKQRNTLIFLIPKFLSHSETVSINLTYVDKFVWDGEISECQPNLLLRYNSEYICPHVYDSGELWHTHTGKFLRVEDKFKRLLNLNIDCLDEKEASGNDKRVVKILTVITDNLNQSGYKSVDIKSDTVVNFVDEHMRKLHIFSKNTFGNIICDDMCKRNWVI